MSLEYCNKSGQPSAGILAAVLGMRSAEAELGHVGVVVAYGLSSRDEAEQMLPHFVFPTRSHFVLSSPSASAPGGCRSQQK